MERVLEKSGSNADDRALVAAIARGDVDALTEAWRRHGARVWVRAAMICGAASAEDASQEVFLALWRRPEAFDRRRGSLRAFLVLQARARAVDILRARVAAERRDLCWAADRQRLPQVAGAVDWTENDWVDMQTALARLPARERDAIVLAYYVGFTYREVAAMLGQPEGTVKSRIRIGLLRLRADLALAMDQPATPDPVQPATPVETSAAIHRPIPIQAGEPPLPATRVVVV